MLLSGTRAVAILGPWSVSTGSLSVTIPSAASARSYFLLACADDTKGITERSETNNCRASDTPVAVTP